MLIKDLPTLALRNRAYEIREYDREDLWEAINWKTSKEGELFWRLCDTGKFHDAAIICPKYFAGSVFEPYPEKNHIEEAEPGQGFGLWNYKYRVWNKSRLGVMHHEMLLHKARYFFQKCRAEWIEQDRLALKELDRAASANNFADPVCRHQNEI